MELTILGARGSMPLGSAAFSTYGGDTSCYVVKEGGQTLLLDAGTGLTHYQPEGDAPIDILLSHCHVDHLLGLGLFSALRKKNQKIRIYGSRRDGLGIEEQVERLFSPPL